MSAEKPSWVKDILNKIFNKPSSPTKKETHQTRTLRVNVPIVEQVDIELNDDEPDELAQIAARTWAKRKSHYGYRDKDTGEFKIEEID